MKERDTLNVIPSAFDIHFSRPRCLGVWVYGNVRLIIIKFTFFRSNNTPSLMTLISYVFSTYFYTQKSSLNFLSSLLFACPWASFGDSAKGNLSVEIYCLSLIKRHVEAIKSEQTDYRTVNKRFNKKSALCCRRRRVVYWFLIFPLRFQQLNLNIRGEMQMKSVFMSRRKFLVKSWLKRLILPGISKIIWFQIFNNTFYCLHFPVWETLIKTAFNMRFCLVKMF